MTRLSRLRGVGLVSILGLIVGGPVLAEDSATDPQEVFLERVDVDVVNVDVYVTDRKGQPIHGLSAADFQVFEDGRPMKVSNFYAVQGGRLRSEEASVVTEGEASGPDEAPPEEVPLAPEQRLHTVLFVDDFNLSLGLRKRVMNDLEPFVREQMRAEDRLMVVSFDGKLNVVQGFTDQPEKVLAALELISEGASMSGAVFAVERQGILRDIANAPLPVASRPRAVPRGSGAPALRGSPPSDAGSIAVSTAASIQSAIQSYAQRHRNQSFVTLGALSQLVESVAGLPGRKSVVYISEGLSLRPGEVLYRAWENKFLSLRNDDAGTALGQLMGMSDAVNVDATELNLERAFENLARQASARRVTFYGLRPGHGIHVSAEEGTFDLGGLGTPGGGQAYSAGLASLEAANRGGSMRLLADITGGFAITNAGAFQVALNRLRSDFDSFYSLGYAPERERDKRQHSIEVRVPGRKGLTLRYRTRYEDRSREEQMRSRTLAALVHGEVENPLQVAVDVAEAMDGEEGHRKVPVLVKVPMSNLALLPQEDRLVGLVSFHVGARDGQGRTSPIRSVQVPIRVERSNLREAAGRMAAHHFLLEMYPREHEVLVGVRDEIGEVESFTVVAAQP